MTRLKSLSVALQKRLEQRSLFKVISGLNNFDRESVHLVAKAGGQGGADLLDIACEPELVVLAKKASGGLPICVSSIEPTLFPSAVKAGASLVEIGNFDSFYPQGRFFSASDVMDLTIQTRSLLPNVPLSVTIPHVLPLDQQAQLALDLVGAGADLIQTEGGTSSNPQSAGTLGLIEKAAPTLAATYMIQASLLENNSSVPIICASGLSVVTVPMAFAIGASGVGVGSAVNRLSDELEMLAVVKSIRDSVIPSLSINSLCV